MHPFEGMNQQQKAAVLSELPFFDRPVSVPPPIEVGEQPSSPEPLQPAGGGTPIKRGPGRPRKS